MPLRINPQAPGIARRAGRYQRKLVRALAIATRRFSRGDAELATLFRSARVEGVDTKLCLRKGAVSFFAPPFRGGYHQIYDWTYLEESTERDLAADIAWSLRHSLREWRR